MKNYAGKVRAILLENVGTMLGITHTYIVYTKVTIEQAYCSGK